MIIIKIINRSFSVVTEVFTVLLDGCNVAAGVTLKTLLLRLKQLSGDVIRSEQSSTNLSLSRAQERVCVLNLQHMLPTKINCYTFVFAPACHELNSKI